MAVLGSTSLTGCLYIESFLGGVDPITLTGFRCIFENASVSPISWTKDTSYSTNGIALRVVTGSITSRTDRDFSQVFTSVPLGLSITSNSSAVSLGPSPANVSFVAQVISGGPTVTGGELADTVSHRHDFSRNTPTSATPAPNAGILTNNDNLNARQTDLTGGDNQHTHGISYPPHGHPVSSAHPHTVTGSHNHTITPTSQQESFNILYRDVIIATKDIKP